MTERTLAGPERHRAQSEPLAALLSVAAVCFVFSLHVGVLSEVTAELGQDRDIAGPTADAVWQKLRTDGAIEAETDISSTVARPSLPEGYAVAVRVTTVRDDGRVREVGDAAFDTTGEATTLSPPANAETISRPVAVRIRPGDVRPGRLTVEVWE